MAEKSFLEVINSTESIELKGTYLCAQTERDGYTATHQGKYWYEVTLSGEDYVVTPVTYNVETATFEKTNDPIIITEGDSIFYIVGTNVDSYTFPILSKEEVGEDEVIEKQILQAFLAFVKDRFRFGVYNIFVVDAPVVVTP